MFKVKSRVALSILTLVAVCGVSIYAWAHVISRAHKHTLTGGVVYISSRGTITMLHADVTATLTDRGGGFFDLTETTQQTQSANCTFDDDPTDKNPAKQALCSWPGGLTCTRLQVGDCKGGIRTSFSSCTTPDADCRGTVIVQFFDGSKPETIDVRKDPAIGTDPKACNEEFPKTADLPRGEMARVDQVCNPKQAWSANDLVLRDFWRTDVSLFEPTQARFSSQGTWHALLEAICNPADGIATGSCQQESIIHITFPVSDPKACSATNQVCGQRANGTFGPLARDCDFDKKSGQCTCACPRCDEISTFVNVGFPPSGGTPGTGHFTISDLNAKETAACPLTLRGTTE
jgi:hypothetical protein